MGDKSLIIEFKKCLIERFKIERQYIRSKMETADILTDLMEKEADIYAEECQYFFET